VAPVPATKATIASAQAPGQPDMPRSRRTEPAAITAASTSHMATWTVAGRYSARSAASWLPAPATCQPATTITTAIFSARR
jgi:hypothetical protein